MNATDPNRQRAARQWWGQTEFTTDQVRRWRLGQSTFWVQRHELEWRLFQLERPLNWTALPDARRGSHDSLAQPGRQPGSGPGREAGGESYIENGVISSEADIHEDATLDRFALGHRGMNLTITPLLADRPVVVRPESPFHVPAGEDVTLYVSTPLWMKFEVGPPSRFLAERTPQRPSDTWFGPSTLVGELCYASRTSGRLRLSELPQRPHRAITPVRIRNNAKDALLLERVKVPVQFLTLYRAKDGGLWTQTATLVREHDGDFAALQLGKRSPTEASGAERVTQPRQQLDHHLSLRAFSRLFWSG